MWCWFPPLIAVQITRFPCGNDDTATAAAPDEGAHRRINQLFLVMPAQMSLFQRPLRAKAPTAGLPGARRESGALDGVRAVTPRDRASSTAALSARNAPRAMVRYQIMVVCPK